MKTLSKLLLEALLFLVLNVSFLTAQTCDEVLVNEIDKIKQEIETMLVFSTTAKVKLVSGETLLAFYKDGSLIKISVDNNENDGPYFSAELFFKDGFIRHIAEEYSKSGKFFKDYLYFTDSKLICCNNEKTGDYKSSVYYAKAETKWIKKVNVYLEAIQ